MIFLSCRCAAKPAAAVLCDPVSDCRSQRDILSSSKVLSYQLTVTFNCLWLGRFTTSQPVSANRFLAVILTRLRLLCRAEILCFSQSFALRSRHPGLAKERSGRSL